MSDIIITGQTQSQTIIIPLRVNYEIYAIVNSITASVLIKSHRWGVISGVPTLTAILQLTWPSLPVGAYAYSIKKVSDDSVIQSGNIIVQKPQGSPLPDFRTVGGQSIIGEGDIPTGGSFEGTLDDIPDGVTYQKVTSTEKTTWNSKVSDNDSRLTNSRDPNAHSHSESEITNLTTDLSNKEPANANIQAHISSTHAPSNAQKNSDITKAEIEAVLTGLITSHSHSGGADPFIAKLVLAADKPTGANTTPVTLGMSFNYEANSKYIIDIYALVLPAAATTGCGFMIDTDTAVTYAGLFVSHQLANTGTVSGSGSVGDRGVTSQGVSSGMPSIATHFVGGQGILITGANTGVATFYFGSEITAVTTCKSGSIFRIMKV